MTHSSPLPPLSVIPSAIAAVKDYEPYAQARLSPAAWAYFSEGAADETLKQKNEHAFDRYAIWPRVLQDLTQAHTRIQLLGNEYKYPIFLAPVAYQRMAHPDGELATALGAAAMQTPFIVSMQSSVDLAVLAQHAPGPRWLQWYWQADQRASQQLLSYAQQLGIEAIVLTVDASVSGIRNQTQRLGFSLPTDVDAVLLRAFKQSAAPAVPAGQSPLLETPFMQQLPTWSDIKAFIAASPLPVILKGILHPDDARKALELGAAGIIVSNHGGRVLDKAPTSLAALPAVVAAVNGAVPVLVDGGVRRGSDVFVALALGASAVLIGRPYIYALAAAGASGVAHALHILRTELEVTMALAGCATIDAISTAHLYEP